jgi:CysZ protein
MFPLAITLRTLFAVKLIRLMLACALLALAVAAGIAVFLTWLTAYWVNFEPAWVNTALTWLTGAVTGIGGWFMLPALTVLIGGIFQERVIDRVERYYYPHTLRPEAPKFWPDFWYDVRFTLKALSLNLLVLPFYFVGIGFFISILLNSYLLGHEFFESVVGHHFGKPRAREVSKQNRSIVYAGGLVITLMTLTPILNLFVPILAVVWMVHAYHGISRRSK